LFKGPPLCHQHHNNHNNHNNQNNDNKHVAIAFKMEIRSTNM
jgi:hypothetical protein